VCVCLLQDEPAGADGECVAGPGVRRVGELQLRQSAVPGRATAAAETPAQPDGRQLPPPMAAGEFLLQHLRAS